MQEARKHNPKWGEKSVIWNGPRIDTELADEDVKTIITTARMFQELSRDR